MLSLTDKDNTRIYILKHINSKPIFQNFIQVMFSKELDWFIRHTYPNDALNESKICFPYFSKEDNCLGAYSCINDTIIDTKLLSFREDNIKYIIFFICIDEHGYALRASRVETIVHHTILDIQQYMYGILGDKFKIHTPCIDTYGIVWKETNPSVYGCYCTLFMHKIFDSYISTDWDDFYLLSLRDSMINRVLRYGIVHSYTRCMYIPNDIFLIYTPNITIRVFSNGIVQKMNIVNEMESSIQCEIVHEHKCIVSNNTNLYCIALDIFSQ
jgi:hypothetical protein